LQYRAASSYDWPAGPSMCSKFPDWRWFLLD
jgi:hypothetical protein